MPTKQTLKYKNSNSKTERTSEQKYLEHSWKPKRQLQIKHQGAQELDLKKKTNKRSKVQTT
jgi:hypothetical protein